MPASATRGAPAAVPPASLDFRVLRAVPFATVCVVLAAAGHAMGSGAAVPLRAVVLGWLLVLAAAVSGARRERSLTAITGAMAGGQLGLHLLFHAEQAYQAERTPVRAQTAPAGMAGMGDMPGMPGMSGVLTRPRRAPSWARRPGSRRTPPRPSRRTWRCGATPGCSG